MSLYRVYYEDTDFSGFVYHARYLHFFERARTDFIREKGVEQAQLYADTGCSFVVRKLHIDYLKAARMDDLVRIVTRIGQVRGASLVFEQELFVQDVLYTKANVLVAMVCAGKPARLSQSLMECLLGSAS